MSTAPLYAVWTGDSLAPLSRFRKECDASLVIGERYRIEVIGDRSDKSHRHFFAALHQYWLNLPESVAMDFPTDEDLRHRALIMTGHAHSRQFVASSKAEAARIAAFVRACPFYSIVTVKDYVVTELTPMSQSKRAMGNARFQKSKSDVLEYCEALIGARAPESEAA